MARKTYVLDTNILISDPEAILHFRENDVLLSSATLSELDNIKNSSTKSETTKFNSRQAVRNLNKYMDCDIEDGWYMLYDENIRFKIDFRSFSDSKIFEYYTEEGMNSKNDNTILALAYESNNSVLVSNDSIMNAKAKAIGVNVETYKTIEIDSLEKFNTTEIQLTYEQIESLQNGEPVFVDGLISGKYYIATGYKLIKCINNAGRIVPVEHKFIKTKYDARTYIAAKNAEQNFFIDSLNDPDKEVVVALGSAGSGKTLLSVASGLMQVADDGTYNEIVIVKPPVQITGKDRLGFMPGDLFDKMVAYLRGVISALKYMYKNNKNAVLSYANKVGMQEIKTDEDLLKALIKNGIIRIAPIDTIKGETFHNAFIIVDEAQDLTYLEAKSLMTRIGDGTKIVVIGDTDQISAQYVNELNSGISIIANAYFGEDFASVIRMQKVERSRIAEIAVERI